MKTFSVRDAKVTGGFWKELQDLNAQVSIFNIYKRFEETGRFKALECVKDEAHVPHIFWDSDVAKWLESAAYILAQREDETLRNIVEKTVDTICAHQLPCGYFNTYYQVYAPDKIFAQRTEHELYCAGHLIEAAVALKEYKIEERLYAAMLRYADYICERFLVKKDTAFTTCGHPEIELALVKLYAASRDKKYLDLAAFFLDERGKSDTDFYPWADLTYDQSHLPLRQQRTAEGHAVRALYLYIAAADVARLKGDASLAEACHAVFGDIVEKKMYLTGGTGSTHFGEAFTFPYDLPNVFAYSETCSAIALAFFCDRLAKLENKAIYHEIFERVLYNNILAGESKDGKAFFYVNPLEMHADIYDYNEKRKSKLYCPLPERVEVFDCSCCPPNLIRFIEQIGSFVYGASEDERVIFVNQYVSSETEIGGACLSLRTDMPYGGKAEISFSGRAELRLRVPAWQNGISLSIDQKEVAPRVEAGYIALELDGEHEISLNFHIRPRFVYANENVSCDCGRKAVEYGPLVLCGESVDNGGNLRAVRIPSLDGAKADRGEYFTLTVAAERLRTSSALYSYDPPVSEPCTLKLIPYFAWANRGKGDMQIWWL